MSYDDVAPLSDTYADVDGSGDVAEAIAWQERIDRGPAVVAYKRRSHEQLEGLEPVVDLGAGPGVDAAGSCSPSPASSSAAPEVEPDR
ncbi:MAG: hypothetical protein ACRD0A_21155 [Acidimicrobiales bacterium]